MQTSHSLVVFIEVQTVKFGIWFNYSYENNVYENR